MSRKPRVFDVVGIDTYNYVHNRMPGGAELCDGDMIAARGRVGGPIEMILVVPSRVFERYFRQRITLDGTRVDDALDWFADVIAFGIAENLSLWILLSPSDQAVVRACGSPQPHWERVEISMQTSTPGCVVRVAYAPDLDSPALQSLKRDTDALVGLPLLENYRRLFAASASIIVALEPKYYSGRDLRSELTASWDLGHIERCYGAVWPVDGPSRNYLRADPHDLWVFSGAWSERVSIATVLRRFFGANLLDLRLSRPDCLFTIDLSRPNRALIDQKPVVESRYRWTTQHALITELALILMAGGLPPYVVLEIIDWLPTMDRRKHGTKIALIVGLQASINALRRHPPNKSR